jgi:hypothetical protein
MSVSGKRTYSDTNVRKSRRIINKNIRLESQTFSTETFNTSINFIRFFMKICVLNGYTIQEILKMRLISKSYQMAIDPIIASLLKNYKFEQCRLTIQGPIETQTLSYNYVWTLIHKIVHKKKKKNVPTNLVLLLAVQYFKIGDILNFIDGIVQYIVENKKCLIITDTGTIDPLKYYRLFGSIIIFGGGHLIKDNYKYGFLMYMHTNRCKHIRIMLSHPIDIDHTMLNEIVKSSIVPIQDIYIGGDLTFDEDDILFCEDGCSSYRFYHENEYSLNNGNYRPMYKEDSMVAYPFIENITNPFYAEYGASP